MKHNNMNFLDYMESCSNNELLELKKEIVSLLILDKENIAKNENVRFIYSKHSLLRVVIDVVEDIEEVLKQLKQQEDIHSIIAGVIQLVKVDSYIGSHLQSASFYKNWIKKGYINQIKENIKLMY